MVITFFCKCYIFKGNLLWTSSIPPSLWTHTLGVQLELSRHCSLSGDSQETQWLENMIFKEHFNMYWVLSAIGAEAMSAPYLKGT